MDNEPSQVCFIKTDGIIHHYTQASTAVMFKFVTWTFNLDRPTDKKSNMRAAKAQTSHRIRVVLSEPSLLEYTKK